MKTNPPAAMQEEVYHGARNPVTYKDVPKPEGFDSEIALLGWGEGTRTSYASTFSDYSSLFRSKVHEVERKLAHAEQDLNFLSLRLANWKPQTSE